MDKFSGFPKESINFYKELSLNNNKRWFDDHKDDYENFVLKPARHFVYEMGNKLKTISPKIIADPRINKSIFRIFRDVRFSKDKTPYKTHLGLWFWEGDRKRMECSGYYLQIEPDSILLGTGIYMFPKNLLETYRNALASEKFGKQFSSAVKKITDTGIYHIGGKSLKKIPRGYESNNKNAEFLLFEGLYSGFSTEIPDAFFNETFIDYCMAHYIKMRPLHDWIVEIFS